MVYDWLVPMADRRHTILHMVVAYPKHIRSTRDRRTKTHGRPAADSERT